MQVLMKSSQPSKRQHKKNQTEKNKNVRKKYWKMNNDQKVKLETNEEI